MKYAALIFTILALGACPTVPEPQNFLDKLAGQNSLKIQELEDAGGLRAIVTSTFSIQDGGKLFVKDGAPTITLKFVKELGNYVAQYIYYDGAAEKGVRYFTAVGGGIFISEALPDPTPTPTPPPAPPVLAPKDFLDKIKELAGKSVLIEQRYSYMVSPDGKTLTDSPGKYEFRWVKSTGDYGAAYNLYYTGSTPNSFIVTKIFTWKNGYYVSDTVEFGS